MQKTAKSGVKSKEIVIVFGKGKKKSEVVLKAGRGASSVSAILLHQQPVHHKKIKIKNQKGEGKEVVKTESHKIWDQAKGAIKRLEVTAEPIPDNSGDAICFETPMGWFCIE